VEFTHRLGGHVFCARNSFADYGDHVHGHEQRNSRSDGRSKENARVTRKNINGN
jgi:hypothetical protein